MPNEDVQAMRLELLEQGYGCRVSEPEDSPGQTGIIYPGQEVYLLELKATSPRQLALVQSGVYVGYSSGRDPFASLFRRAPNSNPPLKAIRWHANTSDSFFPKGQKFGLDRPETGAYLIVSSLDAPPYEIIDRRPPAQRREHPLSA